MVSKAVKNLQWFKNGNCSVDIIYNDGQLPETWTIEKLFAKHPSHPYNPLVANTFFVAGYIESWGRGIDKIFDACKSAGLQKPVYDIDANGIMIEIKANVDWNGNKINYDENGNRQTIVILSIMYLFI